MQTKELDANILIRAEADALAESKEEYKRDQMRMKSNYRREKEEDRKREDLRKRIENSPAEANRMRRHEKRKHELVE